MAENSGSATVMAESWIGRGSNALLRMGGRGEVALLAVTAIGLSTTGVLPFSVVLGQWPGLNLLEILSIGLVFCLLPAYIYSAIGAAVPRAGADYVFASRVLNGPLAFISSWVFVLFSGMAAGSWVADLVKTTTQSFLRMLGLLLNRPAIIDLSQSILQPGIVILIGTLVIMLAYLTMLVPPRVFYRTLWIGFALAVVAWGIILLILATGTSRAFQDGWNQFMGANSFTQVIPAALAAGLKANPDGQLTGQIGMVIGFWLFCGYFVPTFFAGEIKKSGSTLLTGSWLGLGFVWAVLSGSAYLLSRLAPADWLAAESLLKQTQTASGQAMPWLPFYAMILAPSIPLVLVLFLAWLYTTVNLIQVMMGYMSRILLAWAEDGLLPAGMDYIHPRFRSPLLTLLVAAALVQAGLVNALLGSLWGSHFSLPFMAALAMVIPVCAMTVFPYLKPDWFETMPAFVRAHVGPIRLVSILGGIALFSLLWYVSSSVILRTGPNPLNWGDEVALAVIVGSGLAWYGGRRIHLRSKGVRLEEKFKDLP